MTFPSPHCHNGTGQIWNVHFIRKGTVIMAISMHTLRCRDSINLSEFFPRHWSPCPISAGERHPKILELDWARVQFANYLIGDETSITAGEKFRRQQAARHVRFGGNVFLSLWRDYTDHKGVSILEWLYRSRGVAFLDFSALVLVDPTNGNRCVPCLCRSEEEGGVGIWYPRSLWFHDLCDATKLSPFLPTATLEPKTLVASS